MAQVVLLDLCEYRSCWYILVWLLLLLRLGPLLLLFHQAERIEAGSRFLHRLWLCLSLCLGLLMRLRLRIRLELRLLLWLL